MITEAVLVAFIGGTFTLLGSYIILRRETHKDNVKRAKREAFIDAKLQAIEKKLDEHNHYAEKFTRTDIRIGEIEKSIVRIDTTLLSIIKKG